ncbi:hypothetical protein ACFWXO_43715 [Kitasatospora sp. NPDC059088]|uniref:hypothetical protein n=1 Tax=Kitasatospora sp. NPDC059088 TaxID=3346722 RepID=UPI0036800DC5
MAANVTLTKETPTTPAAAAVGPGDDTDALAEPEDVNEEAADDDEAGESIRERVTRVLSRAFNAARPYIIGIQAVKSLAVGTFIIVKKTVFWIVDGNALELFAPGIVRKRERKAKAAKAAARAKAKAASGGPKPKGRGPRRRPAKPANAKEKPPQEQPESQLPEGKELPAWLLRAGGLLFAGFLIVYYIPHNPVIWMPALLVPWALAAWVYAPLPAPKANEQEQADDEDEAFEDDDLVEAGPPEVQEAGEQGAGERRVLSAEEIEAQFWLYVENTVATRWAEGVRGIKQGVHLEDMLADLKARNMISDPAWDTATLASYFRRIGIPLRDPLPLSVAGKKINRIGVGFKELTHTLGREPLRPPHLAVDRTPRDDAFPAPGAPPPAGPPPPPPPRGGRGRAAPPPPPPRGPGRGAEHPRSDPPSDGRLTPADRPGNAPPADPSRAVRRPALPRFAITGNAPYRSALPAL